MLGFSLTKLIFTVVVVYAVWQGFKIFGRMQVERAKHDGKKRKAKPSGRASSRTEKGGVEDMVKCSVCEAYVARGANNCGQDGCPFKG